VKSIVVVVLDVVVELAVVDLVPDVFADLVSALASFVWDAVVVFALGVLDPFAVVVTFGAFVTFAVVFVVLGDSVGLGAFGDDTLTGAGPFPFAAAACGANVRHNTIAVPSVIRRMRMVFTSLGGQQRKCRSPESDERP
jgi:hypothetical protein